MSRPPKITDEIIGDIEAALMLGANQEIAALYAGVSEGTFYNWKNRGELVRDRLEAEEQKYHARKQEIAQAKAAKLPPPSPYKPNYKTTADEQLYLKFLEAVRRAGAYGAVNHLNYLDKLAPHTPQVSMWLLERRFPEAFGPPVQRKEISGRDGGAIETKDVSDMTADEKAVRILAIVNAAKARMEEGDV